jgi:hypothetical protein
MQVNVDLVYSLPYPSVDQSDNSMIGRRCNAHLRQRQLRMFTNGSTVQILHHTLTNSIVRIDQVDLWQLYVNCVSNYNTGISILVVRAVSSVDKR